MGTGRAGEATVFGGTDVISGYLTSVSPARTAFGSRASRARHSGDGFRCFGNSLRNTASKSIRVPPSLDAQIHLDRGRNPRWPAPDSRYRLLRKASPYDLVERCA